MGNFWWAFAAMGAGFLLALLVLAIIRLAGGAPNGSYDFRVVIPTIALSAVGIAFVGGLLRAVSHNSDRKNQDFIGKLLNVVATIFTFMAGAFALPLGVYNHFALVAMIILVLLVALLLAGRSLLKLWRRRS